jgi:hypothetical protein
MLNLGFELWWTRATTTPLTTQPQVGSLALFFYMIDTISRVYSWKKKKNSASRELERNSVTDAKRIKPF